MASGHQGDPGPPVSIEPLNDIPLEELLERMPDDGELGTHVWSRWRKVILAAAGVPDGYMDEGLERAFVAATLEKETENAQYTGLEKALHRGAKGDLVGCGRIFRSHVQTALRLNIAERFAKAMDKVRAQRADFLAKGKQATQKYTGADRATWRAMAAAPDLSPIKSKKRRAEVIAERLNLPTSAVESIRRALPK